MDWKRIVLTETIGKTLARYPKLKKLKDWVDRFGRSKLPILPSITPPLLHLTENMKHPILSLHIAAGNILAAQGKKVVQVITDPHVRDEYLDHAEKLNICFCVFDQKTKTEFLEKASLLGKKVDEKRVIVTGPPIDPRVIKAKRKKTAWRSGALNMVLATGGLGTNKTEIRKILKQFFPKLKKKQCPCRLMLYAGTQKDIFEMGKQLAKENGIHAEIINHSQLVNILDKHSRQKHHHNFYILYHPQIVDANELLVEHAFGWSHGFITKPSGDMAYDAVASGNFLLTLSEWGEWEHNIYEFFSSKEIARKAQVDDLHAQIAALEKSGWIERAMNKALKLNGIFDKGSENIIKVVESFK